MFEWKGFAKFWLWFCLIINALVLVLGVIGLFGVVALGADGLGILIFSLVAEVGMIAGLAILLFMKKKLGFYIVAAMGVCNVILNAMSGQLVKGIASAIISLVILFFAIKGNWNEME